MTFSIRPERPSTKPRLRSTVGWRSRGKGSATAGAKRSTSRQRRDLSGEKSNSCSTTLTHWRRMGRCESLRLLKTPRYNLRSQRRKWRSQRWRRVKWRGGSRRRSLMCSNAGAC